jgi:hypothetical protein
LSLSKGDNIENPLTGALTLDETPRSRLGGRGRVQDAVAAQYRPGHGRLEGAHFTTIATRVCASAGSSGLRKGVSLATVDQYHSLCRVRWRVQEGMLA